MKTTIPASQRLARGERNLAVEEEFISATAALMALAAERELLADEEGEPEKADTPWAEAVRLERPLYVTPGTYTVRVTAGGRSADTEFEVEAPSRREPRVPSEPRIRGEKRGGGG